MPQVVVGAAAIAASIGTSAIGSQIAISLAIAGATTAAQLAFAPKVAATPATPISAAPANGRRSVPSQQSSPFRRNVYGSTRVGGALFLIENSNPHTIVGALLSDGHGSGIESVDAVYFGETQVAINPSTGAALAGTKYEGNFDMNWRPGLNSQQVDPLVFALFPELGFQFRQRGVATGVVRLNYGADANEHNDLWGGSIAPTYAVKGLKVYDPRDPAQSLSDRSTWVYSDNPALCTAHAMTNAWVASIDEDDMDFASVASAADYCDEEIIVDGISQKRFVLSGILEAGVPLGRQIEEMLSSFAGAVTYADGKYFIHADAPADPVWTIEDQDMTGSSGFEFRFASPQAKTPNAVKALHYDANDANTQVTTPLYVDEAAVAADGRRRTLSVQLPFTADGNSAQLLAIRAMLKARDGRQLRLPVSDAGLYLRPHDVVTVNSTKAPQLNGDYRVSRVDAVEVGSVLTMEGYSSAFYADDTSLIQ